jgi:alpha-N-arabinofuranosidase
MQTPGASWTPLPCTTKPGRGRDWQHKGSATQFTAADYYHTLRKAVAIEPIIERHLQVMDRHDPEHRVGLIVTSGGTWFTVEPGTNPGFLYQQNQCATRWWRRSR